jgi:predicted aspartyl protease
MRYLCAIGFACALLLASLVAHGSAQQRRTATRDEVASAANPEEPEALYAAPTRLDRVGRIVAAVEVNGYGPFRFIVDTGANRSAISPRLVTELGLVPAVKGKGTVGLHGVTGFASLPSVDVATLRAGEFEVVPGPLPVLTSAVFADTDGILGMEGFEDYRIEVDFTADRVNIKRSDGRRPRGGFYLVRAKKQRGLLIVDGSAGRIPVKAIIDTGAERTLGNAALRDALSGRTDPRGRVQSRVVGATDATYIGTAFQVSSLRLGSTRLRNLPVTFGDMHVFEIWGLSQEPAVLIGMDLIGKLRRFAVDYRRSEIQFMPYTEARGAVRKCGPTECRSRIPDPDRT